MRRLLEGLAARTPATMVFATLLLFGFLYRATLTVELFTHEVTPLSFVANRYTLLSGLRYFTWDVLFAAVVAVLVGAAALVGRGLAERRWARVAGWGLVYVLMLAVGITTGLQHDVLFVAHVGLTYDIVGEGVSTGDPADALSYSTHVGVLCCLAPAVILTALRLLPGRLDAARARALATMGVVSVVGVLPSAVLFALDLDPSTPKWALKAVPVHFVVDDLLHHALRGEGTYERMQRLLPPVRAEGLRITSAEYERAETPRPLLRRARGGAPPDRWNVVFIIMESTGAEYVFDTKHAGVVPMPFLKKLAGEGVYLKRHYASSNTSPRSIFTLMSGVYALPKVHMFCTRPDVLIPGLGEYLGDGYDKFLMTPSRLQSYFPRAFLERSGVREMYGYYTVPDTARPRWPGGRHELDVVDFFLGRLARAEEPFFATYYSYAPHYHYYDYGPDYRISKGDEPIDRYYDNLRLLDTQIERIYRQLEASGRLERTVLVLVGDHGEAFGQHPGNWTHSRQSYDENVRAPAIFHQPKLFAPAEVTELTSHVDVLPTLLDALGIEVPAGRFQGDSLFGGLRGAYRFFYGNEDTLSSVSRDGKKVQVLFRTDTCRAFDLAVDPQEETPLKCSELQPQLDAMLRFGRFQARQLPEYNAGLRR